MIPIIRLELRQRRFYTLWWSVALVALVALLMFIYPSIRDHAQELNQIAHQVPSNIRALKGIQGNLASPISYLNAQVFYVTLPMMLSILTIGLGSSLLARDEQDRTLELLLSRPIGRGKLIAAKAISGLVITAIVSTAVIAALLLFAHLVNMDVSSNALLVASLFCIVMAIAYGAIAFALTAASSGTRRISIAAAIAVAFGGYILTALAKSTDALDGPSKFFPYHYYVPEDILNGRLSGSFTIFIVGIVVVAAVAAFLGFRRRDIE